MSQLDYALIGNCQLSALLDREGSYVWSCLPRFDSPSVFGKLLGDNAGSWTIVPENPQFTTYQSYLRNTNIVRTEYEFDNGDRFELLDFAPRFPFFEGYYHSPQFMRIIRVLKGNPRITMKLQPRFEYGQFVPQVSTLKNQILYEHEKDRLYLATDIPQTYLLEEIPFELTGTRYCVLSWGQPFEEELPAKVEQYFVLTRNYWRSWVKHCNIPFEYQDAVIRSALALKLHIYEDTGAIIAATTTSIPESTGSGRTWDYRFCWLRDSYFVLHALDQLGHFEEMEGFISFLHNVASGEKDGHLQPLYGIAGQKELIETTLPWLPGFKGNGPVRVGNAAYTHHQHDVYGEMVLSMSRLFFDNRLDHLDKNRVFESIISLVDRAIWAFDKPDSGLWEFRGEMRHYVFSKILCWCAVDRGLRIAARLGKLDSYPHWQDAETRMRKVIEEKGWSEAHQMYIQSYERPVPDASNLLMGALRFHTGDDSKYKSTVEQYEKRLLKHGYAYRYCDSDDFGIPENSFSICTFWLVDALVQIGRGNEARVIFERLLKSANHVGLLSEDVAPLSGELWGNFPQAYSHVGVINSAFLLSSSWREAF